MNALYYGDNLDILRRYIPDASVDLLSLDPPFNTNRSYNVLFREAGRDAGTSPSQVQITAFDDTSHCGSTAKKGGEKVKGKSRFHLTRKDEPIAELVSKTEHRILAVWAMDCVERVLPYFEEKYPQDQRPRNAIAALRTWIITGMFRMVDIRKASLAAHAAAREVGEDNATRSAARAAGQAVATAHVPMHSVAAANYALQAIHRATNASDADAAVARERDWQHRHLLELRNSQDVGTVRTGAGSGGKG